MPPRRPEYPTDRVERELRQRIEAGEWPKGTQIPNVGELSDQHRASRTTISKAVQRLVDSGLLVVLPNYGTFTAELPGPGHPNCCQKRAQLLPN